MLLQIDFFDFFDFFDMVMDTDMGEIPAFVIIVFVSGISGV